MSAFAVSWKYIFGGLGHEAEDSFSSIHKDTIGFFFGGSTPELRIEAYRKLYLYHSSCLPTWSATLYGT